MKNASPGEGARRVDAGSIPASTTVPSLAFRIISLERVGPFGTKTAVGTFALDGIGQFNFELFMPQGKAASITPASVRSKYNGQYARTFRLDVDFRAALLEAVLSELDADNRS